MAHPSKPHKNQDFNLHTVVPGDLMIKVDAAAEKLAAETGLTVTRTDIVKRALAAYVDSGLGARR